jgi:hypothetical protein
LVHFYVDGILVKESFWDGEIDRESNNSKAIGVLFRPTNQVHGYFFNGYIDYVKIYSKELSLEDISLIYETTKTNYK